MSRTANSGKILFIFIPRNLCVEHMALLKSPAAITANSTADYRNIPESIIIIIVKS